VGIILGVVWLVQLLTGRRDETRDLAERER